MVAISLVAILGIAGLAIDGGRAYVTRAQLSRAVDAAALAGAASLRLGQATAQQRIESLAAANGVDPALLDINFGVNEQGENTVSVSANRIMPTTFMRVLGQTQVDVGSAAEATIPPLDLTLVLDKSGSLGFMDAWDDLQDASRNFVGKFSDTIDQMGLIAFSNRAEEMAPLNQPFTGAITAEINGLTSVGYTNTGEALRLAYGQINSTSGAVRQRSVRVVVFFTDGRPTAFRGAVDNGTNTADRIAAVSWKDNDRVAGYWNNPDQVSMTSYPTFNGCRDVSMCGPWTEETVRQKSIDYGAEWANAIRDDGVFVYTIGLGNPNASDPLIAPDMDYLRELANEDGVANGGQPQGHAYFAPSAAELQAVFNSVAQDILVRLTQ
jgi:hypothetical protein